MCFLRIWLTTISKESPFGQGYFFKTSSVIELFWYFFLGIYLRCFFELVVVDRLAFPPMTVLKNVTIYSFWPQSFLIMDKNSPNYILPELSQSTESIKLLISSLVQNRPTDNRNSYNQSMPMDPVFLSSKELKQCFISFLSSLLKSIRYFLPLVLSHFLSQYCFRYSQLSFSCSRWAFLDCS